MANIKFGNGWADARGKVGGVVYSRNRSGAYARTYVKPTNPRTPAQVASRNRFSYVSSSYRGLTDSERNAWAYSASQVTYPNKVGDQVHPTASQYFNKQNMAIFAGGGTAIVTTPSALVDIVGLVNLTAIATITTGTISALELTGLLVDGTNVVPAGYSVQLRATPTLSSGISRPQPSNYTLIQSLASTTSLVDIDVLSRYSLFFPAPAEGGNVWFSMEVTNNVTGQRSQVLEAKLSYVTA